MSDIPDRGQETLHNLVPHLEGNAARICGEIRPVSSIYRLLQPDSGKQSSLYEFYSEKLQNRLIMFEREGNTARTHQILQDKDVKLFDEMMLAEKVFLIVPQSAKRLDTIVPLLGRDPVAREEVFVKLGKSLAQLEAAGFGLPAQGHVFSQFAVATGEHGADNELYFIPPYTMDRSYGVADVWHDLIDEVNATNLQDFDKNMVIAAVEHGWYDN